MLKVLMEKTNSVHEQMKNFGSEVEIIKKNQMKILKVKNSNKGKKNALDGSLVELIQLKIISTLEDRLKEISQMRAQREKKSKAKTKNLDSKSFGTISKLPTYV